MIKATGRHSDGRPLLVLGLSRVNCQRLLDDQPIIVNTSEVDLEWGWILLYAGETEAAMRDELAGRFRIGDMRGDPSVPEPIVRAYGNAVDQLTAATDARMSLLAQGRLEGICLAWRELYDHDDSDDVLHAAWDRWRHSQHGAAAGKGAPTSEVPPAPPSHGDHVPPIDKARRFDGE